MWRDRSHGVLWSSRVFDPNAGRRSWRRRRSKGGGRGGRGRGGEMKPFRAFLLVSFLVVVVFMFSYHLRQPSYWENVVHSQDAAAQVSSSSSSTHSIGNSNRTGNGISCPVRTHARTHTHPGLIYTQQSSRNPFLSRRPRANFFQNST